MKLWHLYGYDYGYWKRGVNSNAKTVRKAENAVIRFEVKAQGSLSPLE